MPQPISPEAWKESSDPAERGARPPVCAANSVARDGTPPKFVSRIPRTISATIPAARVTCIVPPRCHSLADDRQMQLGLNVILHRRAFAIIVALVALLGAAPIDSC